MPLVKVVKVNSAIIYGIWEIVEELDTLLSHKAFNNHGNMETAILHPKKQLEYATSRILISHLCSEIGYNYNGLIKDEFGKPYLPNCDYQLSISHSFPFAIAILNKNGSAGIDIEYPNAKLERISSKFLNEKELKYKESLVDLCKVWCVKETLYKIYGRKKVDYKKHLHVNLDVSVDRCIGTFSNEKFTNSYEIKIEEFKDYIYCYNI